MRQFAIRCVLGAALLAQPLVAAAQPRPPAAAPKLTRPPRLVKFVEAVYPEAEKASGKTATVVLRVGISATGTVDAADVAESAGAAFDAAAIAAVKQFVFEPAEVDGKPAPIRILYRYEFVLKAEAPTKAVFEGVVRDRRTKKPIAGVIVELATGQKASTDASGKFRFEDVAPGKHSVAISGDKLTSQRTEEVFEAGKRVEATYDVEEQAPAAPGEAGDDLEIVIVAPPLRKQVVSTQISADQGRKVAGTQGDVLKVVENLPGVGRASVGSGQLVVWGAAPQDTRVYVDGVRIPRLYHNGGLRSVIHSDLVQSVDLAPGGYGAPYGRGLGGIVTVELRPLADDGFHGSVSADLFDASAMTKVSITDKLRVAVAARYGYLDRLLPLVTSRDTGVLFPIPQYYDGQARVAYAIDERSSIELGGMLSSDAVERTVASADPSARKSERSSIKYNRVYLRWRREIEGGSAVTVLPWAGTESSSLVSRFGGTPTELTNDSTVFGLRASWRGKPMKNLVVTAGLDTEGVFASLRRSGSVTSPAREGDIRVFGQAPSDRISADSWRAAIVSVAPYVEADISLLGDKLHILPGLRFEPYVFTASRRTPIEGNTPSIGAFSNTTVLEPRIAATFDVSPRVRVKAAYGLYHQPPLVEDLSAAFGNPLLSVSTAHHWLASAAFKLTQTLTVETTGFYSLSSDLTARSPLSAPLLAQALVQQGAGRAYGAQILVRQELMKGLFGWVTYSILRSERQDRPDRPYRLFDFDQTHVLTALASYEIGWGFEAGVRFRVASGFPRTPVERAYYDGRTDTYQPLYGAQNSTRIPTFIQLDARISKRFKFGTRFELETYLDVQNVTNRGNPEEIVYSYDYTKKDYIRGLPILPSLGARFAW